ncbi:hypothetical protein WJX73_007636 [Symbiochloris irregularis]|uniref:Uncharacterized protein n=1 Tax=Symbiochloris irregularis TaxID=706552 RepID=A0AAW1P2Y5_9CHLO
MTSSRATSLVLAMTALSFLHIAAADRHLHSFIDYSANKHSAASKGTKPVINAQEWASALREDGHNLRRQMLWGSSGSSGSSGGTGTSAT